MSVPADFCVHCWGLFSEKYKLNYHTDQLMFLIAYPCERFTLRSSFNMLKGAHIHVLWNLNNRGTQNEWFISECESCFFPYNESEWWPWLSSKSFQSHPDFCDIWGMFVLFWNENPPIIMMYFYNYLKIFVCIDTETVVLVPHAQDNSDTSIEILIILLCWKYRIVTIAWTLSLN